MRHFSIAAAAVWAAASSPAPASPALAICHQRYALCASSPTVAIPGETVKVGGTTFPAGVSVCPVLRGPSIADLSLFSNVKNYPQLPDWAVLPSVKRTFVTNANAGGGMSNMWSFPCVVRPRKVNGVRLADCKGPMNESPWTGDIVPFGATVGTAAPEGVPNPVGGNLA